MDVATKASVWSFTDSAGVVLVKLLRLAATRETLATDGFFSNRAECSASKVRRKAQVEPLRQCLAWGSCDGRHRRPPGPLVSASRYATAGCPPLMWTSTRGAAAQ